MLLEAHSIYSQSFSGFIGFGQRPFNYAAAAYVDFTMSQANLNAGGGNVPMYTFTSGQPDPSCATSGVQKPIVGYQNGVFVDNTAIFFPWAIASNSGGLTCVIPHGVLMTYTPANGPFNSNTGTPNQWQWHDMNADSPYATRGCSPADTTHYCPMSFNSGVPVGHHIYLLPDFLAVKPVFAMITTTGGFPNFVYNYQDANNVGFSSGTGWSTGGYDGRYVYMSPTNTNTKLVQKDTLVDADNSLSASGWKGFSPKTNSCAGGDGFTNFTGNLGMAIVNNRYVYSIPTSTGSVMSIYDNTGDFQSCAAWKSIDLSLLGTSGHPSLSAAGIVSSQVTGFAGAIIAITNNDTSNGTVYLYCIPWSFTRGSGGSLQSSIVARVQVGHFTSGTFHYDDPSSAGAVWQAFDLSTLTGNSAWAAHNLGPKNFVSQGAMQSVLSGYQLGWINPTTWSVIFSSANAKYYLTHQPTKALSDATAWSLIPVDANYSNNSFGGPFDSVNAMIYPSGYQPPANKSTSLVVMIQATLPAGI